MIQTQARPTTETLHRAAGRRAPGALGALARLPLLPLLLILAALGLSLPGAAAAQSKVYIDINESSREPFPLAIPLFKNTGDAEADELGRQLAEAVQADLALTGLFKLLPREAFLEDPATAGVKHGTFDFQSWRAMDALGLVKGSYEAKSANIRVELRLYDVLAGTMITGKVYTGVRSNLRPLVHKMANEIVYQFTGESGFFNSKIALVSDATGSKEIYIMDVDGLGMLPITRNGSINLSPTWAPGGSALGFTSYKKDNPDLYVSDLVQGVTRRVASYEGGNVAPSFHPNGKEIAITLSKDGDSELYLLDTKGEIIKRLTDSYGIDVSPVFSPDGKRIAFVSNRQGGAHIFVMNADGTDIRRLTYAGSQNTSPVWSPKGDRIAFCGRDQGAFDIFVMNADGTNIVRLTQDQGNNEDPSFSPDGHYLVFSSTRKTSKPQLVISSLDGRFQTVITDGKAGYYNPEWSPFVDW